MCPVLIVRLEVPAPLEVKTSDGGFNEVLRFGDDAVAESVTVPLKPFTLVSVIVLVVEEPLPRLTDVGFAVIEKSPVGVGDETVSDTLVVWCRVPLDPVTVIV